MSEDANEDYEKTIKRLTILFSKGEISEESYKKAVKTLEEEMHKKIPPQSRICPHCKKIILKGFKVCPYCLGSIDDYTKSHSHHTYYAEPTQLWYLVPLLFGIIGGLIGYVAVKDEDKDMAGNLIALGILMTVLESIFIWVSYNAIISRLF